MQPTTISKKWKEWVPKGQLKFLFVCPFVLSERGVNIRPEKIIFNFKKLLN